MEVELVLDCHLALGLAWVHEGLDLEGLQLGACTERLTLQSLPLPAKKQDNEGEDSC